MPRFSLFVINNFLSSLDLSYYKARVTKAQVHKTGTNTPRGTGILKFARSGAKTVVRRAFARAPLRFLIPTNRGSAAWVYTSNYGGGFVGGDHIAIRIHVEHGAEAVLLSQSTTKIYRTLGDRTASQELTATVEPHGSLILIPDPVSCFAGSDFSQNQNIHLGDEASLLLIDTVTCGQLASGERWLLDSFQNRISVSQNQKLLYFDSLLLNQKTSGDLNIGNLAQRMGRFNLFCTVLLFGPAFSLHGREILAYMSAQPVQKKTKLIVSASPIHGDGVAIRMAGESTEDLTNTLRQYLSFLPHQLGDNPWARKW